MQLGMFMRSLSVTNTCQNEFIIIIKSANLREQLTPITAYNAFLNDWLIALCFLY